MTYTFLKKMRGMEIGSSLYDEDGSLIVEELVEKAKSKGVKLCFPEDFITADKFDKNANVSLAISIHAYYASILCHLRLVQLLLTVAYLLDGWDWTVDPNLSKSSPL